MAGSSPINFLRITNLAGTLTKYYGLDITPASAGAVSVTVSVSGNQLCAGRVTGVKRCFDIAPAAVLTATVRFYLSEAERNGQALNDLLVWHYSGSWAEEPGPYTRGGAGDAQYVQVQNVNDFSPFALAAAGGGITSTVYLPIVMNRWPPIPDTPTLNAISNPGGSGNYTVSWNAAYLANTYTLQEANDAAFSSPVVVYGPGSGLSWLAGRVVGTYYYRVKASNSYGDSGWSNVQSVTVQPLVTGPTPGFWESTTGDEFYVSPDRANVLKFAIYVNVPNCGTIKITRVTAVPISNNSFSFTGSMYASGTFDTATLAHGTDGLNNYYSTTCQKTLNGGPWSWTATWKNS